MTRAVGYVLVCSLLTWLSAASPGIAQNVGPTRETKVRQDKQNLAENDIWIYNDLDRGLAEAKRTGKPLFVVIRCIPCDACSEFDAELLDKENEVTDLFDRFVCVRIVQGNGLDLSLFQFDYDQSFHAMFLTADKTILARYGTRSRRPESEDMTMPGLRHAMLAVLELNANYPANRDQLSGKQPRPSRYHVPEEMPALSDRYTSKLDYEGEVVRSCIHCHQIRDNQRVDYRNANKPLPLELMYPFPLPETIGLWMNPDEMATVVSVDQGSIAAKAGLMPGDAIASLAGQPLLSTADLQWVLHTAPEQGTLAAEVMREGKSLALELKLDPQWRHRTDISWRVTTWPLRRMVTGGLTLEDLPDDERRGRKIAPKALALRVVRVAQYGDHAAGKKAGFEVGDVIVAAGDLANRMTESQFMEAAFAYPTGTSLDMTVLRGDRKLTLELPMQQ